LWWGAYVRDAARASREREREREHEMGADEVASEYHVHATLEADEPKAFEHLLTWRPDFALLQVFEVLTQRAAGSGDHKLVDVIAARERPPRVMASLMAAALRSGMQMVLAFKG
jgi:hypothetical protein